MKIVRVFSRKTNWFLFSGRQIYLHNPKPHSFIIFIWEWNSIAGLEITNSKGNKLKRIPAVVNIGINRDLEKFKKTNYPWYLTSGE